MTLGDRIAVMRSGVLQQVGPPSELYAHPNSLFVAGFIGSPSMNFLPGELEGDKVRLPIGEVALPEELQQKLGAGPGGGRRGVIAGLRPEDFEDASLVGDTSRGTTFKTRIDVLESMGAEYYAYFVVESERVSSSELEELAQDAGAADLPHSHEGSQVVARLDAASKVRKGEEIELWFNSWHLHLFDPETGRSLLAGGRGRSARRRCRVTSPPHMPTPRSTGMPGVDAQNDFLRARRRATAARVAARLRGVPDDVGVILPYEEVIEALGFVSERSEGLKVVPLDLIVGTVDRERDFDRRFRPTSSRSPQSLGAHRGGDAPR